MPPNPTLFNRPRYTNKLGVKGINANLARYGELELNRAYDALRALSVNANYQVQAHAQYAKLRNCHLWANNIIGVNHNVVARALNRFKREMFMVKLADMQNDSTNGHARGIITQYANAMHAAHAGPNYHNPAPAEVNDFNNSAVLGGPGVTLGRHGLERVTTHFINLITDICDHVAADWELINDLFFPADTMVSLHNIRIMESDPHKGGKRVCFLDFKVLPPDDPVIPATRFRAARGGPNHIDGAFLPTRRLVYKPFDMEMDYRFVANTIDAANRLGVANAGQLPPTTQGGSLLEVVDPTLPTYMILPRNFGSAMAQDAHGNVANIRNAYGYLEFLSHEPERDPNTFDPMRVLKPNGNPKSWSSCQDHELDWVATTIAEVDDFYDTMGQYMAIAMTFSMADCHQGNVMVHRRRPHLIDLEIAFKSPTATIGSTMLHNGVAGHQDVHEPTYNQLYYFRGRGVPRPTWLLRDNGRFAPGNLANRQAKWFDKIADGFDKALRRMILIEGAGGNALTDWLADADVQNSFARYTVEPTATYFGRLETLCQNHILEAVPALLNQAAGPLNWAGMGAGYAGLPAWCDNLITGWLGAAATFGLQNWTTTNAAGVLNPVRPTWATHYPHNLIDLFNWDIPGYYHRVSNMHLLNSHGRVVDIPAWNAAWLMVAPVNQWWWTGYTNLGGPQQANFQAMLPNQTVDFFRVVPTAFVTAQINNLTNVANQAVYNHEMAWIPNIMGQITVPNS